LQELEETVLALRISDNCVHNSNTTPIYMLKTRNYKDLKQCNIIQQLAEIV